MLGVKTSGRQISEPTQRPALGKPKNRPEPDVKWLYQTLKGVGGEKSLRKVCEAEKRKSTRLGEHVLGGTRMRGDRNG